MRLRHLSKTGAIVLVLLIAAGLAGCKDDGNVDLGGAPTSDAGAPGNGTGENDGTDDDDNTPVAMRCNPDAPAIERKRIAEDAVTQSTDVDGQTIDVHMSVFQPALAKGECAPVIIKSHGFGGSRLTSLDDVSDDDRVVSVATRDAWRDGYFVVTFDQRGFGQTGGTVQVEDPGHEGHDIQAVVNYAVKNLGEHLAMRDGNALVGGLGLSYGGGFQLLGAAVDSRFDAIVPAATWYSLPQSLNPNGAPKTAWLTLLVALGASGSEGNLASFIYEGFTQAETLGRIDDNIVDELRDNGLNYYCEGMPASGRGVPRVDAFFVQGASDTLFNMNEAYRNAECLRGAGNDVRVLIERTGHILPLLQNKDDQLGFAVDSQVTCGNQTYSTAERMRSFLDEKLRGKPAEPPIDTNCIVQNDDHGIVVDKFPVGGMRYDIGEKTFTTGPGVSNVRAVLQGILEDGKLLNTVATQIGMTVPNLTSLLTDLVFNILIDNPTELPDSVKNFLTGDVLGLLPPRLLNELSNPKLTTKLFTADRDMTIAGIPTADLTLSAVGDDIGLTDPIAYVGLGIERADDSQGPRLMNQQVMPLRGSGEYEQPLVGVSKQIQQGDSVYLLVYGFNNQYYATFNRVIELASLTGTVHLPLTDD